MTCTPAAPRHLPNQSEIPLHRIGTKIYDVNSTRRYTVTGMTCSHCVLSVREEVSEISGVTAVDVDLASGRLSVEGAGVPDDAVLSAVADAGYAAEAA
jgi:copper chaperone CopZ